MKRINCGNSNIRNYSKIVLARIKLEERIRKKIIKRYDHPLSYHDMKLIDDILYNEKTHFVGTFKEHLIYDDPNEFLRRFYNESEIKIRLPKILMFYEKYSKIYANYTVIQEQKYMYKNIKRKQKVIDQMQGKSEDDSEDETNEEKEVLDTRIFNTRVLNSINSFTMSLYYNTSNNKSKSDSSVNKLLLKLNKFEKKSELFKRKLKYDNSRNYIGIKKKQIISNKALSNNIHSLLTNSKTNNNEKKNKNSLNKISDSLKIEKTIFSNKTSPKFITKKILSSTPSKIIKKKMSYLSPSVSINHSGKNSIIQKIFSNSKNRKQPETERNVKNNYHSKIFSYKYKNLNNRLNLNINKIQKNKVMNNKEGLTSNNIYNNNELLKNLILNNNSVFNTPKSQNSNSNLSLNKNFKKTTIPKNNSTKFGLNLRKIIFNNFPDSKSSSTDRKTIKKNFYGRIGKYFKKNYGNTNENKTNSSSKINKISVKENKSIFKRISKLNTKNKRSQEKKNINNNNNSVKKNKNPNHSRVLSSNNNNSLSVNVRRVASIHVNLGEKFKIKNFENINIISKINEDFLLHSERLKKTKIIINK